MAWDAILSGGLSLLGGIGGASSAAAAAERQYAHQKEMAQNRYQWLTKDLTKAGLNHMLAIGGASPPSVGSGGIADIAGGFQKGVAGVGAARMQRDLVKKTKAEAETAQHEERSRRWDQWIKDENMNLLQTENRIKREEHRSAVARRQMTESGVAAAKDAEAIDRSEFGRWMRRMQRFSRSVQGAPRPGLDFSNKRRTRRGSIR